MTIELHTWNTPNGRKISVALEEMGLPYKMIPVNITKGEQMAPVVPFGGIVERIDDFLVTLRDSEGRIRSLPRNGDRPKVTIHDPLQPHLDALEHYTDQSIHDITAYLVTLK